MPVIITKQPPVIVLTGPDYEPHDLAWSTADASDRAAYWGQVALAMRDAKYRELSRGIDVAGDRLAPRLHPRRDGATGPVLSPHWSASRFQSELRWSQRNGREAVLSWAAPWARIVGIWAERETAAVRDVVGLTDASLAWVRARAGKWWAARGATGRTDGDGVTTLPGDRQRIDEASRNGTWTGWRIPPPRAAESIFAPPRPAPVLPSLPGRLPAHEVIHRTKEWWLRAGVRGQASEAQAESIVRRMGRSQDQATLVETARRLGVTRPIRSKAEALAVIRANLVERVRSAQEAGAVRPPPVPKPVPVPPILPRITYRADRVVARETAATILGTAPTDQGLVALAGAPAGGTTKVGVGFGPAVTLETEVPAPGGGVAGWSFARLHREGARAVLSIDDVIVYERSQGRGIGTRLVARQIEAARKLGVDRLDMRAVRDDAAGKFGYRVWPRMGFDGPIPPHVRSILPPELAGARLVSDLLRTAAGRVWWTAHGDSANLVFDLSARSASWRTYQAYLRGRP